MKFYWLILIFYMIFEACCDLDRNILQRMLVEVIKDTNTRIGHLSVIKQACQGRAAFEIGYLMYVLFDKYRRMVDKYHTTRFMRNRYFIGEYILMLVDVEIEYWEIEHIGNMLHEIERKYVVQGGLDEDYELPPTTTVTTAMTRPTYKLRISKSRTKRKHFNQQKYMMSKLAPTLSKKKKNKWWPIDYGWEIDYYW